MVTCPHCDARVSETEGYRNDKGMYCPECGEGFQYGR